MLKQDITHSSTLKAIERYEITDEMIEMIENLDVLRLFIKNLSRRKWQREHKNYYKKRYELVKTGDYKPGSVDYDKTPEQINLEPKERIIRSPEYRRQYNREYYHRKRKKAKVEKPVKIFCCENCKTEIQAEKKN